MAEGQAPSGRGGRRRSRPGRAARTRGRSTRARRARRGPGATGAAPSRWPYTRAGPGRAGSAACESAVTRPRRSPRPLMDPVAAAARGSLQAALVLALLFVLPGLALGPVARARSHRRRSHRRPGGRRQSTDGAAACTLLAWLGCSAPPIARRRPRRPHRRSRSLRPADAPGRRCATLRRARDRARGAPVVGVAAGRGGSSPSRSSSFRRGAAVGGRRLPLQLDGLVLRQPGPRAVAETGGFPATLAGVGDARARSSSTTCRSPRTPRRPSRCCPGLDCGVVLEVYRLAVLRRGVLFAALLFRRWVSSWIAVLGACLLLATVRLEAKFLDYRPETWALVLALFTLWLVDRAMVERSRRLAPRPRPWRPRSSSWPTPRCSSSSGRGDRRARGRAPPRRPGGRPGLRVPARRDRRRLAVARLAGGVFVGGMSSAGRPRPRRHRRRVRVRRLRHARRTAAGAPAPAPADESRPAGRSRGDPTWDFYVAAVAPGARGSAPPRPLLRLAAAAAVDPATSGPVSTAGRGAASRSSALLLAAPLILAGRCSTPRRRRRVLGCGRLRRRPARRARTSCSRLRTPTSRCGPGRAG